VVHWPDGVDDVVRVSELLWQPSVHKAAFREYPEELHGHGAIVPCSGFGWLAVQRPETAGPQSEPATDLRAILRIRLVDPLLTI
jgi:hypothetical protein